MFCDSENTEVKCNTSWSGRILKRKFGSIARTFRKQKAQDAIKYHTAGQLEGSHRAAILKKIFFKAYALSKELIIPKLIGEVFAVRVGQISKVYGGVANGVRCGDYRCGGRTRAGSRLLNASE